MNDNTTENISECKNLISPASLRVVFMGTPDFAVPSLLSLIKEGYNVVGVVTQSDKPQGRHMVLTPPPVKITALHNDIPVFQPDNLRNEEFISQMKALSLDLIVTAAYGKILPVSILALPRLGCINVHASLLPLYRGAAPVQWCLINGDAKTGITIMQMDKGMDTGAILAQRSIDITFDMDAGTLMQELSLLGSQMLSSTIMDYCNSRIKPVSQDETLATNVKPISKEDGLINWNETVVMVHNRIRGCNPWPVAYTFYQGRRLKILKSKPQEFLPVLENGNEEIFPGCTIVSEDKKHLAIACFDGLIEILELQLEGSKKMSANECAHNFIASATSQTRNSMTSTKNECAHNPISSAPVGLKED